MVFSDVLCVALEVIIGFSLFLSGLFAGEIVKIPVQTLACCQTNTNSTHTPTQYIPSTSVPGRVKAAAAALRVVASCRSVSRGSVSRDSW